MSRKMEQKGFNHFEFRKVSRNHHGFRSCNICDELFVPSSHFDRYCRDCKQESEVFKYGDWLPELDEHLAAKFL